MLPLFSSGLSATTASVVKNIAQPKLRFAERASYFCWVNP
ncbi:hypothetical protein B4168_0376 [Anoxybacillus flavithermus]|nr:hypothetical protein B4168_0376 [Anoxybacillus flavithermus]